MELNPTKESVEDRTSTTNRAGGPAFDPDSPEMGLYKVTINNLLEDIYYREDEEALQDVMHRFEQCVQENPEFPLKLAAYARLEQYLRDIPQVLLVLASNNEKTKKFVDKWAPEIIQRADEPATVVATQIELFGKPIPRPLRRGITKSLGNFDRYQYRKYATKGNREVDMRDVLNLVRPNPNKIDPFDSTDYEEIFERLMKGSLDRHPDIHPLESPETWETKLSERGNKESTWLEILPRMGLFAKIRNVRNMKEKGVQSEEIFDEDDLEYVENSMIYPFQFYQAYRSIKEEGLLDEHLLWFFEQAVEKTVDNIPSLGGSAVAIDLSGSMSSSTLSANSVITYKDISAFLGSCASFIDAMTIGFATETETYDFPGNTNVLDRAEYISSRGGVGGHSTNGYKVIRFLRDEVPFSVDRIIFLTDMQLWRDNNFSGRIGQNNPEELKDQFEQYRKIKNPDTKLYMIDLSSYGSLKTPEGMPGVFNISGWTSKVFDWIDSIENTDEIIQKIKSYNPV